MTMYFDATHRRDVEDEGVLVRVRMHSVDPSTEVGIAVEEVRPRHENRRPLLAASNVQDPCYAKDNSIVKSFF